ncbi:alpha/beta fold hydrolase [Thiorhodovibrio frisius]|uniref:Putative hydrolase or acyltransferase of alpha/beta superfamily n=1 Tax=Thiorhodovibrio frisius TaxID=631362 RepID=H8YXZ7_9GAMM|nr:alpha/beta hydrolase [Thiorhodovibrio frisius]EIC23323.1 putative hydrolase or acyltransferase of alpha/beta superfamily [Thiorhodovibrio frisius]WPL23597.1 Non-heme chloroperoxidase [Thiorhodovibrio frisius]
MPASNVLSFRNADGRRIAWHEFGQPDGRPVFYCHGFPSSGREAALLHQPATALGLRLIAPDRPGYGGSDDQPGLELRDWPTDLAALADHLGIERFALLGLSGGGPYALACAWRLPERLSARILVCPLGPVYLQEVLAAMHRPARSSLALAKRSPWLAQRLYGGPTPWLLARWPGLVEHVRTLNLPSKDLTALSAGDNQAILNSTIGDAMARGARGARRDLHLYTHDWRIPCDAIHAPISIWHGEADATVPPAHARWYRDHLSGANLTTLPDQGHFSLPIHFGERILRGLIADD